MRLVLGLLAVVTISIGILGSEGNQRAYALTIREWSGKGLTPNWSNPANWAGNELPQNGDFLVFGEVLQGINTTIVNDMTDLSVARVFFRDRFYSVSGNSLQVTEVVGIDDDAVAVLDLPITGTTEVIVAPSSALKLTGNNSFTGRVDVRGTLDVGSNTALGSPAGITRATAPGQIRILNEVTSVGSEQFVIQGDGSGSSQAIYGALWIGPADLTIANLEIVDSAVVSSNGLVHFPGGLQTFEPGDRLELRFGTFVFSGQSDRALIQLALGADVVWNSVMPIGTIYTVPPAPGEVPLVPNDSQIWGSGSIGGVILDTGDEISARVGNAPTLLTVATDDLLVSNAAITVLINGTAPGSGYSQLAVGEDMVFGPGVELKVALNFMPPDGESFRIIDVVDPAESVFGTFEGLPEGANFSLGGKQWTITYMGGTGNDVVISTAPAAPADPRPYKQALPMVARD